MITPRYSKQQDGTTAGQEPLVIDIPGPLNGRVWFVHALSFLGRLATRTFQAGGSPGSGLFLVPTEENPETLADASGAATGFQLPARAIALPCQFNSTAIGAGTPFAVSIIWNGGVDLLVPAGWKLRAIINCLPGTATPGPGTASTGVLSVLATVEVDDQPRPRR